MVSLTAGRSAVNICSMSKRLKHEILSGPNGGVLKVSWMPGNRVQLEFIKSGKCAVTKIFPDPRGETHVELSYGANK
jgi:hypothetical protein